MGFSAPSKLWFAAAALFLVAVAIGLSEQGFELRSMLGLALAGVMVAFGFKARKPIKDSGQP